MKVGCTRFVFIPGSGACALLPPVSRSQLLRTSNPATVAGTVFVGRDATSAPAVRHARCSFEINHGYNQGALGAGSPLDGPRITSHQECCDACERHPQCVKFVFEKYGGSCQLFESFAEQYKVPGLIAGMILSRAALGSTFDAIEAGGMLMPPSHPPLHLSPFPPALVTIGSPPPAPPSDDEEGSAAMVVLKFGSILVFIIISLGVLLCGYCFYFGEIQGALYEVSGGRMGKPKFSLLPKSLQEVTQAEHQEGLPKKKKGKKAKQALLVDKGPVEGQASVTCVTSQMTQKKEVDVADCATFDELLTTTREEFGHMLGDTRPKELALLCWVGHPETSSGAWMTVGAASDTQAVIQSGALKLVLKSAVSEAETAIAYPKSLAVPKPALPGETVVETANKHGKDRAAGNGGQRRVSKADVPPQASIQAEQAGMGYDPKLMEAFAEFMKSQGAPAEPQGAEEALEESHSEEESVPTTGRPARGCSDEQHWSDDDQVDRLSATMDSHEGVRISRRVRRPVVPDDDDGGDPLCPTGFSSQAARASAEQELPSRATRAPAPQVGAAAADDDDMGEHGLRETQAQREALVGKRVRVCHLQSKMELNGRVGTVASIDKAKDRFRVRLDSDTIDGFATILAFKYQNLQAI